MISLLILLVAMMSSSSNMQFNQCKKHDVANKKQYAPLPTLPDDALTEIIARLPPKPFFRFKCVAKSWLTLSSEAFSKNKFLQKPDFYGLFINNLVQRTNNGINFKFLSGNRKEVDVKLSPLQNLGQMKIKDCSNGLLLIDIEEPDSLMGVMHLFVYNPAIRKLIELPVLKRPLCTYYQHFALAYDPEISPKFHVVWFKIVTMPDRWHTAFEIFSSRNGRWEAGKDFPGTLKFYPWHTSIYLGGMTHQLGKGRLISVNPTEGVYSVTKLPDQKFGPSSFSNLAKSRGLLHYLVVKYDKLFIWICTDFDKNEWILKRELSLRETFGLSWTEFADHNMRAPKVITLHPEKDVLFLSVRHRKLLSYDLNNGIRNIVFTLPHNGNLCFWNYTPCYSDFVVANE